MKGDDFVESNTTQSPIRKKSQVMMAGDPVSTGVASRNTSLEDKCYLFLNLDWT